MTDLVFPPPLSRRVFVQGVGYVTLGLILGVAGGCDLDKILDAIANRPIRRRLRTGSAEVDADIATYRQAVSLMKGRTDARGWASQAAIHGTAAAGFNLCKHNSDHFFDWHRGYLAYFEKICQKLTGNAKFGLPYWNWNQDPAIHPAFLDSTSSLFQARGRTTMAGHPTQPTGDTALNGIMGDGNFFTFSQQLEGTPHNSVHTWIGGAFGGGGSATDPNFWCHHCMVDYCWAKWNIELDNDNTSQSAWVNTNHTSFVDGDGNPAEIEAGLTTIMPLLTYQYESSAIGGSPPSPAITSKRDFQRLERRIRAGADIRFEVKERYVVAERAAIALPRPFSGPARLTPGAVARIVQSDAAAEKLFASVDFASLPPTSDFSVKVFVNLPGATRATPIDDPHYAGSFAFFGTELSGEPARAAPAAQGQPRFLVDITPTVQRLKRSGEVTDQSQLSVQLVATPFADKLEREDTQLVLNRIEILITPVVVRSKR